MLRKNFKIKSIKIAAVLMFTLVGFTSCEDAYEIDPADEIVESNAITNLSDVQSALIGAYSTMGANTSVYWNSLFTDELQLPSSNNGQGIQVHTWSINSDNGEASGLYSSYYTTISRLNRVLEAIPNIEVEAGEEEELNGYKGELLAMRAWAHFKLFSFFSTSYTDGSALSVPYVDYVAVLEKPARNTVDEVLAGISADLTAARTLIPASATDNTFFTRNAVLALEARIALYTEDYPTAADKASQLISQYSLSSIASYPNLWVDADDSENIFKLARVIGDGAVGQLFSPSDALIYWVASDKLMESYDANDVRLSSFFGDGTTANRVMKYPGDASAFGLNDIKEFRISEQYLIRAEALANMAQLDLAAADLNALRTNRINGVAPISFTGLVDAMDKILEERYREFAFEAHRFFDLKRTDSGVSRQSSDCDILQATACDMPDTDYRFSLPIPQSEIFANPNAVQNPGYNN